MDVLEIAFGFTACIGALLADIIRHRAAEVLADAMPTDLQSSISNLPN